MSDQEESTALVGGLTWEGDDVRAPRHYGLCRWLPWVEKLPVPDEAYAVIVGTKHWPLREVHREPLTFGFCTAKVGWRPEPQPPAPVCITLVLMRGQYQRSVHL